MQLHGQVTVMLRPLFGERATVYDGLPTYQETHPFAGVPGSYRFGQLQITRVYTDTSRMPVMGARARLCVGRCNPILFSDQLPPPTNSCTKLRLHPAQQVEAGATLCEMPRPVTYLARAKHRPIHTWLGERSSSKFYNYLLKLTAEACEFGT